MQGKPNYMKIIQDVLLDIERSGVGARLEEQTTVGNDRVFRYRLTDGTEGDPHKSPYYQPAVSLRDGRNREVYETETKVMRAMSRHGLRPNGKEFNKVSVIISFLDDKDDKLKAYLIQTKDNEKYLAFHVQE